MAKNFQVNRNKKKELNIYEKKKQVNNQTENLSKDQKLRNGIKLWASFYRNNIHRYIEDYFGVRLHTFQKIILFLISKNSFFLWWASRGIGKSFIVALYCLAMASLKPGIPIVVASGTKNQARAVITLKIDKELRLKYPNIAREIKQVKTGADECVVILHNGSTISAVASNDNARGYRAAILINDEFRLIKEDVITRVLRPFLNYVRTPKFLSLPEYKGRQKEFIKYEETQEVYISSAWYTSHWSYEKFKAFLESMVRGRDYFTCAFPYQLALHHGLLSEKRVEQMRTEDDLDSIGWQMEMDTLPYGAAENAFFKINDIERCRTIVRPFYPTDKYTFIENREKSKSRGKKSNTGLDKQIGEIRLVSMDVALMKGNDNDNTIFTCMRLLPDGTNYIRQVPYIESMHGVHSEDQAIRLKQLFYDFEADYVVMDTAGSGMSIYDYCSRILYDNDRDIEYSPWTAINNEEMKDRVVDPNALPVVYSMKVVKAEVNHEIAVWLKTAFEKRLIRLLVNDAEGKEYLIEKQDLMNKNSYEHAMLLKPYVQTTALINELINLESEVKNGFIKVHEKGRSTKDRYSSLGYANYIARLLEQENLQKKEDNSNILDYLFV
ncbi:terminase large subunit domain-containing protein [Paenibacillus oleatilyticus]|uniref:terminase large subunit domain-containing protein n=1 Tax=Paenibacillus oleatilyticus TaxID=2594886 RepID=UPI001C200F9E|nr:terminase family protein [Paenibacillus oleatilyticus]MBU7316135.1 terminase family protein [Paenibacillus oleatilyticus]